jgi:hypothetical protein
MTTDSSNPDPQQQLAAFADGELDGEQNLAVLQRLGEDPATAEHVAGHQKLRQAVAGVMDDPALKAPAELRDRISQLAQTVPAHDHNGQHADTGSDTGPSVLAFIGRWIPAAVAAVLLIGALVALNMVNNSGSGQLIGSSNILNASMVDQFGSRHFKCSRGIAPMYGTDQFPQDLTQLPGALSEYFGQPVEPDALNLSALGFQFDVAGLCILPGKGSVHIVYESQAPTGQTDTLSLWLRPYEADLDIEPDKLYASQATQETYPMIVWRHGDMVYYLVGDDYDTVQRAFDAISQNQG